MTRAVGIGLMQQNRSIAESYLVKICLENGEAVGRIFKANAAPVGSPWMWTLIFPHHEGRSPTHGYEATREAAMRPTKRITDKVMRPQMNYQSQAFPYWR